MKSPQDDLKSLLLLGKASCEANYELPVWSFKSQLYFGHTLSNQTVFPVVANSWINVVKISCPYNVRGKSNHESGKGWAEDDACHPMLTEYFLCLHA